MDSIRRKHLEEFEKIIEVNFHDKDLLNKALTHSSYANENGLKYNDHNERLEFLGDSVLSLIVSEYIFKKYKDRQEGKLSRIRASVVCESSLAELARAIKLEKYLRIGKGEELTGGRNKDSLLADATEAVIAAIYLDQGYNKAKDFVLNKLKHKIQNVARGREYIDFKSRLQEYVQRNLLSTIKYEVANQWGPDHDKTFEIEVYLDNIKYGLGVGKSKKEAEQMAAKNALIKLGVDVNE
ncbi:MULTISPECIES: ribonuclease III [unclassified Caloramator]|uniref:ribonuclease III n=1 Tax=unclassified Caloramator TaxID=2629145 RepID=UPI00237EC48C|nr:MULTISPECIES: ribonuclease III [unclassified Caloramator]MDO6354120.1 ribonuclease III [Caloramator sp. CAR-1]WDU84057.1 ribonuclease III [Caloramator sp. Dgby_cultured_2]